MIRWNYPFKVASAYSIRILNQHTAIIRGFITPNDASSLRHADRRYAVPSYEAKNQTCKLISMENLLIQELQSTSAQPLWTSYRYSMRNTYNGKHSIASANAYEHGEPTKFAA